MDKKQAEQEFHDQSFANNTRASLYRFYNVMKNGRARYLEAILGDCAGKAVLEYGCGSDGSDAFTLARHGARVVGVDISPVAVLMSQQLAEEKNLADRVRFAVSDAEKLDFSDATFDMVVGSGILHHLDLERSFAEIRRVLKPGGKAVFLEPLAYNPAIALYRVFTPSMRTRDEHPLRRRDITLARRSLGQVRLTFYCMISLVNVLLMSSSAPERALRVTDAIDQALFRWVLPLRWLAWQVLIVAETPARSARVECKRGGCASAAAKARD